jgi:hypothetical protein
MVNFLVVGLPDKAVAESVPQLSRSLGKGESADPASASRQTLVRLFGIGHMLKNCQNS